MVHDALQRRSASRATTWPLLSDTRILLGCDEMRSTLETFVVPPMTC